METIVRKRKEKEISKEKLYKSLKKMGNDIKRDSLSKWESNLEIPNVRQFLDLCELLGFEGANAMFGLMTKVVIIIFLFHQTDFQKMQIFQLP